MTDDYTEPDLDDDELADPQELTVAELEQIADDAGYESWDAYQDAAQQDADDASDYYNGPGVP